MRGTCLGRCPAYSVAIWGDGRVVYKGKHFVLKAGRQEWRLSEQRIESIATAINESGLFSLRDSPLEPLPDHPRLLVSIKMGDGRRRNIENVEEEEALETLAARIDKLAGLHDYAYRPETDNFEGGDHGL